MLKTMHDHTFAEIIAVSSGVVVHTINGSVETLEKGDAVFIFPEDYHGVETPNDCKIINISITSEVLENIKKMVGFCKEGHDFTHYLKKRTKIPPQKLKNIIDDAKNLMSEDMHSTYYRAKVKSIFLELLPYFIRRPYTHEYEYMKMPQWMSDVCSAYESVENLAAGLSVAYRISQKSPEHVSREFKKHFAITPIQYINNKRINYCKNRLISSNTPVSQICYEAGYESLANFYAKFKELTGVTPAVYKKQYGKMLSQSDRKPKPDSPKS